MSRVRLCVDIKTYKPKKPKKPKNLKTFLKNLRFLPALVSTLTICTDVQYMWSAVSLSLSIVIKAYYRMRQSSATLQWWTLFLQNLGGFVHGRFNCFAKHKRSRSSIKSHSHITFRLPKQPRFFPFNDTGILF